MDYSEFTLLDLSTSTIIFATDCVRNDAIASVLTVPLALALALALA